MMFEGDLARLGWDYSIIMRHEMGSLPGLASLNGGTMIKDTVKDLAFLFFWGLVFIVGYRAWTGDWPPNLPIETIQEIAAAVVILTLLIVAYCWWAILAAVLFVWAVRRFTRSR